MTSAFLQSAFFSKAQLTATAAVKTVSVRYLIHSQTVNFVPLLSFRVNESGAAAGLLTVVQWVTSLLKPYMGVWNLPKVGSSGVAHRYHTCPYVQ